MPIRLGKDAFILGKISPDNADRLLDTIQGFKSLVSAYRPLGFRACATSAMRESLNGEKIRKQILSQTGVDIQIIHGKEEARIIFANNPKAVWRVTISGCLWMWAAAAPRSPFFSDGQSVSRSFGIGTIRLLENLVKRSQWEDLESWISKHTRNFSNPEAVGSGGNINTIIKMAQCKADRTITYDKMKKVRNHLNFFSYEDRITKLGLKPDRADVIMPALKIYMSVMKWGGFGRLPCRRLVWRTGWSGLCTANTSDLKRKKIPLRVEKIDPPIVQDSFRQAFPPCTRCLSTARNAGIYRRQI
jgi:exopolyphosphatase/guanosine-5'-triphosphate,3'-diphosphate pyrophosphatase